MPTIKDIAKRAGVSHGTVSNVLNRRGNVSAEKIKLVEQAAKELGYQINSQASQLRSGTSRHICVIVPRIDMTKYSELYAGIEQELGRQEITLELLCTNGLEYVEQRLLSKALSRNPTAVILVSSLLKNKASVPEGTRIIMLDRYVKGFPKHSVFATFDYARAGREIAEKCVRDGNKNIAVLCEDVSFTDDKRFVEAVSEVFESEGCSFEVFAAPDPMKFNRAFDVLYAADSFDAVIARSDEDVDSLHMANRYNPDVRLPVVYAVVNKEFGLADENRYEMNYKLMGHRIAEDILEKKEERIVEAGSFRSRPRYLVKKEETLRLLSVKNATSKAIRRLLPLFKKQSGIDVKVIEVPYDELRRMVSKMQAGQETVFDLVRIDMAWMEKDGERIYQELDMDSQPMQNVVQKLIPGISEEYSVIHGVTYAIPLDACVQMLFCRKDLFENELIKREFYETYKRKLEVPKTFAEYNQAAGFFTQKNNRRSPTVYGHTLTYGRSFVAACEVMLRYYEKNTSVFDCNGKVRVCTEEMKEAFCTCLESCKYATNDTHLWWRETANMFSDGMTAMNITFSNYASDMVHSINAKAAGKIIFSQVPGGQPLLGGGSIGITRSSSKTAECCKFFEWLYADETAEMVTYLGGFIPNRNIIKNAEVLELYPWIEDIGNMLEKGKRRNREAVNDRFDEFAFEDIIGSAFMNVIFEAAEVEAALRDAQRICDDMFN